MLIRVDFRNRKVIEDTERHILTPIEEIEEPTKFDGILEKLHWEKAKKLGWKFKHFDPISYDHIVSRFGMNQPKGGVLQKPNIKIIDGVFYVDSYGRGCTSNAIGNPYRKNLIEKGYWNRPMPFPVDVLQVFEQLLENNDKIKSIHLGVANDPLAWMDMKYKISKELIAMFNHFNLPYTIYTASDLISHNDYLDVLDKNLATIKIRIPHSINKKDIIENDAAHEFCKNTGIWVDSENINEKFFYNEEICKKVEPGAPSLLRRHNAVNKLIQLQHNVIISRELFWKAV